MYSLGCIIYELINLRIYYKDIFMHEIKTIDPDIYNNKWQEVINSLLQKDFHQRADIDQVIKYIFKGVNNKYEFDTSIFINNRDYLIMDELGKGAFGRIILVKKDLIYYVVKEIKIEENINDIINNIQKEADILSKFNFKNIVKYYDSFKNKDKFYILMEYCDGMNLRDFI